MSTYFYVYVLQSGKDSNFYVGYTNDLRQRLGVHQSGRVKSTKNRLPVTLIYWEGCLNQADAT
jgi:putative endonuclease